MSEISLQNLSKTYNPGLFKKKVEAVRNLSLEIRKGEVFGLIGPNGAGKSTTIRLLLGLTRPDSGTIHFRGKLLREASIQHEIGYLPENPYLYDHLTLHELLDFCGRTSGMELSRRASRIEELLAKVDMTAAQNRPLRTFSKGMLQRAGICFALLHDPAVAVLDEPMSGLDPLGRKLVFDIVMELKEQGKTVFFCSHILSDVERLCDRIGVLVGGRLVREFSRADFTEDATRPVHLVLGPLSARQREAIAALGGCFLEAEGENLLSISAEDLSSVVQKFDEVGVEVRGTQSQRISLEELFTAAIEEAAEENGKVRLQG